MDHLTISEDQGQFILSFTFGLDNEKNEYKIIELKISSFQEVLSRLNTKLYRYMIKYKKKKRREIRKSGTDSIEQLTKELDDTELNVFLEDKHGDIVDASLTNEDVLTPGAALVLQFGNAAHRFSINSLNPPLVKIFRLPDYLMVGYLMYPRIRIENGSRECSEFVWFRRNVTGFIAAEGGQEEDASDCWEKISEGSWHYTPTQDDLGHSLKVVCTPRDHTGAVGSKVECVSKNIVIPGPQECPFEKRHSFTREKTGEGSFRFMTYNILADFYASKMTTLELFYPHVPPYSLDLDYRKQLVIKELLGYNCDILCLQEVDQKVMLYDLEPLLNELGYEGLLRVKRRTSSQGCATFYRKDKFEFVSHHSRSVIDALNEDSEHQELITKMEQKPKIKHQMLIVKNIVLVNVLREKSSGRLLVIGNTHLYSVVKCANIRLLQTAVHMKHIETIVNKYKAAGNDVTVMFCGDLNSAPRSGVNVFLSTGSVPNNHVDWYGAHRDDVLENMNISHPFKLTSMCGFPEYTNFVPGFYGCLDYIYAETDKLKCKQIVPMPSHEDVVKNTALPNQVFPSDHLALICDLEWKDTASS